MCNQMQGHCRKVLKVSGQSTSVEKFFEALGKGASPVVPAVVKAASYQQLTRSFQTNLDFATPDACAPDECEPSANTEQPVKRIVDCFICLARPRQSTRAKVNLLPFGICVTVTTDVAGRPSDS
jgi:hypothetical protein